MTKKIKMKNNYGQEYVYERVLDDQGRLTGYRLVKRPSPKFFGKPVCPDQLPGGFLPFGNYPR